MENKHHELIGNSLPAAPTVLAGARGTDVDGSGGINKAFEHIVAWSVITLNPLPSAALVIHRECGSRSLV